jgi:hypothetical protein
VTSVLLLSLKLHQVKNIIVCWKQLNINTMRSPTKRGVTQNPTDADQGMRRSTRTNKKQPGDYTRKTEGHQTRRSISSKDTKMPKIIKSASSIEKQKLDVLPNPKRANPTATKSHEDSHSNNSKASTKSSIWGSPDMSSGIEKLFEVMGLYNKSKIRLTKSKTSIISMHLCSIKNIIQLSNLDLHDLEICFHVKIYEILYSKILSLKSYV